MYIFDYHLIAGNPLDPIFLMKSRYMKENIHLYILAILIICKKLFLNLFQNK